MRSLDNIAEDLFNKIRGRFPSVTIGDANGKITNDPLQARFFDFDYKEGDRNIGKVSISVSEDKVAVMYSDSFVEDEDSITRQNWYNFLKELRTFAKKRLLQFDTRDITKSNLDRRDYKFLAQKNGGDMTMSESKLYGTSRISYQNIGDARLSIKHTQAVNPELTASRTQHVDRIYIESADGERFMYPYRHLSGARAMARHVSEGGKPFDDFGKYIVGLSEEMAKLRKFKNYMGRSSVMAESLVEYMDAVNDRIVTVKKTIESLQKSKHYAEAFESFEAPVMEDVPADVAENWIEQLTIKQFNEELKDVFPYVYKLVSEVSKAKELGPDDVVSEADDPCWKGYKQIGMKKKGGKEVPNCVPEEAEFERAIEAAMGQFAEAKEVDGESITDELEELAEEHGVAHIIVKNEYGVKFPMSIRTDDEGNKRYAFNNQGFNRNAFVQSFGKDVTPVSEPTEGEAPKGSDTAAKWESDDEMDVKINSKGQLMKADTPDEEEQLPLSEFILSYFDRETGEFPKGETAVLTAIEKDYGDKFITPAKAFIQRVRETFDTHQMEAHPQQMEVDTQAHDDLRRLAGLR